MHKRVTIDESDKALIKAALLHLQKDSIINPSAFPKYKLASAQRMYQLMAKLGIAYEKDEL